MKSQILTSLLCTAWVGTCLCQATDMTPSTTPQTNQIATSIPAANPAPPPAAPAKLSDAELEKLAMPIALHPDPLIAIILPAATYPVEVVQAARFVRDTNNIPKLDQQPWDDKVKQVARFPQVIEMMDTNLQWTVQLGQAFINQSMDLMNAIQALRYKAQKAGNLKTTPQQVVTVTNTIVERSYEGQVIYVTNNVVQVQPAGTQVIYVPSYTPTVYVEDKDEDEAAAAVVTFGVGMAFGAAMWGHCDYHYGGVYWGGYPPYPPPYPPPYYPPPGTRPPPPGGRPPGEVPPGTRPPGERPPGNRPPGGNRPGGGGPSVNPLPAQRWQPDQSRLGSAGAPSVSTRESRGWGSGSGTGPSAGTRPSTGNSISSGARPSTGAVGAANRPSTSAGSSSPRTSTRPDSSTGSGRSAFGDMGNGASSRNYSNRGASSRGGGFGGGRGGGGRGGGRR